MKISVIRTAPRQKTDPLCCLKLGGAFIALSIGSGYATGQEILQFFASFGFYGIAAAILSFLIYMFTATLFFKDGVRLPAQYRNKIFTYYFGPAAGSLLDKFSAVFLYCLFIVMLAGAGSVFKEYYGLPCLAGTLTIGFLSVLLVCMGLTKMVDVIGFIGPVIIVFTICISAVSLFKNFGGLADVRRFICSVPLTKSCSSWLLSGILYPSFGFFIIAPCLPPIGSTASNQKEAATSAFLGVFGYHLTIIISTLAMLASLPSVAGRQVPMLALASASSRAASLAFSVIILLGIFSSAVPFLYSSVLSFCPEGSPRSRLFAAVGGAFAVIAGTYLKFDLLVNKVYTISGYVGAAATALLAAKILIVKARCCRRQIKN